MAKSFSLKPLQQLALQKNDAATKKLGVLNQHQQMAQNKLETLLQYRKDYQEKFQESEARGMTPMDLHNFQNFMRRLDAAIAQQKNVADHAGRSVQLGQQELIDAQRKMKSFDALEQRHIEAERKIEAKLDQRAQDEYAGRFAARQLEKTAITLEESAP